MAVAVVLVVPAIVSACDNSSDLGGLASSTSELTTTTADPNIQPTASTPPSTTAPESRPAERRLVGYSWAAGPPFHKISSQIAFKDGSRSVTATHGVTQHGQLTEFGVAELRSLVNQIPLEETPLAFTGPERMEGANESFAITVTIDGRERVFRYTGSPPPQLEALDSFLWSQIHPLSVCESTDSVEVEEPCKYLSII